MSNRKLVLRKESLTELTDDDLAQVAGAAPVPTVPVGPCLSATCSISCPPACTA